MDGLVLKGNKKHYNHFKQIKPAKLKPSHYSRQLSSVCSARLGFLPSDLKLLSPPPPIISTFFYLHHARPSPASRSASEAQGSDAASARDIWL